MTETDEKDRRSTRKAWKLAAALLNGAERRLVILDGITHVIEDGHLDVNELADTASDMRRIGHGFDEGIQARRRVLTVA